jgi:hypothetical protein
MIASVNPNPPKTRHMPCRSRNSPAITGLHARKKAQKNAGINKTQNMAKATHSGTREMMGWSSNMLGGTAHNGVI